VITLKKKFSDITNFVFNKKVIVRVDFNLPYYDGKVSDFTRVEKILPTINFLLKNKAKVILISHFGRPKGEKNNEFSLNIIKSDVEIILKKKIYFCDDNLKTIKKDKIDKIFKNNEIILMENIRFYPEEIKGDEDFSKKIASIGDIYINECFSVSHRSHSSIVGIPKYLPSFPGMLLENEIFNLKNLITTQNSSTIAVFGGSKISTKLKIVEFYLNKFNKIIFGGAMANTFLKAMEIEIGCSLYEKSMIKIAKEFLEKYSNKILLPDDVIIENKKTNKIEVKPIDTINKEDSIFDIGPKTRLKFYNEIVKTDKLLWNGPLGYYEKKPFDEGTAFVVKAVKNNKNKNFFSVAGGGDTISLLKQNNVFQYFSFISTGGGAFLEFIKGDGLPGLDSLNE
jgi:phosphoglycerate kinase